MITTTTPEHGGIHSADIQNWLAELERAELSTHDCIIARGNEILFEHYLPDFPPDSLHRMYSVSKSFVSIAVGFAMQDGLLKLDDAIGKYFPEEAKEASDVNMSKQTIRQMLMMSTPKNEQNWFEARCDDRVKEYFRHTTTCAPTGSAFMYDSAGSFVLGALVERLTGKKLIDYLREKLLDTLGFSKEAHFLYCPGGYSWGDSALLAKPRDLLLAARFMLNGGSWNGKQLLDAEYVKNATAKQIETAPSEGNGFNGKGYGYLIWQTYDDSFLFYGMGCQFALCIPSSDIIMIFNGDNQGIDNACDLVIRSFFEQVARKVNQPNATQNYALPEDPEAVSALRQYADSLVLTFEHGERTSPIQTDINGRWFALNENPMGITKLCLSLEENAGYLNYTNAQGDKVLPFGLCRNEYSLFPEEGYSKDVGSVFCPGNRYKCAASAAWKAENHLRLNVQAIDDYFGRLWIDLLFDKNTISITMRKDAEDFFGTYSGKADGTRMDGE